MAVSSSGPALSARTRARVRTALTSPGATAGLQRSRKSGLRSGSAGVRVEWVVEEEGVICGLTRTAGKMQDSGEQEQEGQGRRRRPPWGWLAEGPGQGPSLVRGCKVGSRSMTHEPSQGPARSQGVAADSALRPAGPRESDAPQAAANNLEKLRDGANKGAGCQEGDIWHGKRYGACSKQVTPKQSKPRSPSPTAASGPWKGRAAPLKPNQRRFGNDDNRLKPPPCHTLWFAGAAARAAQRGADKTAGTGQRGGAAWH